MLHTFGYTRRMQFEIDTSTGTTMFPNTLTTLALRAAELEVFTLNHGALNNEVRSRLSKTLEVLRLDEEWKTIVKMRRENLTWLKDLEKSLTEDGIRLEKHQRAHESSALE